MFNWGTSYLWSPRHSGSCCQNATGRSLNFHMAQLGRELIIMGWLSTLTLTGWGLWAFGSLLLIFFPLNLVNTKPLLGGSTLRLCRLTPSEEIRLTELVAAAPDWKQEGRWSPCPEPSSQHCLHHLGTLMPKTDFASAECNQASSLCACVTLFLSSSLSSKICKLTREDRTRHWDGQGLTSKVYLPSSSRSFSSC